MKNFVSVAIAPAALIFLLHGAIVEPPAARGRRPPIIDMHLGTSTLDDFGGGAPICADPRSTEYPGLDPRDRITLDRVMTCAKWLPAAASDEALMKESLERLERYNIWAVTSSDNLDRVTAWRAAAPARITPALNFRHRDRTPEQLRRLVEEGKVAVFAEVAPQYGGLRVDDEMYEPYFALAEELDVPVGVHLGEGPPGGIHILGTSTYRARLGSPFVLEEVLVRHKKLRIYVAHYGSPLVDEMIAMLFSHPNLYVDISCNDWLNPRVQFYDHLRRLVEAGFVKRIMWGSDQMIWPWAIDIAIEAVEQAPFLTAEQKRDIFYNNAARFLRLSQAEIAKHHGGALAPSARPRE
jgi:predicted TIM-barrel fold metal-dependent hydrolase